MHDRVLKINKHINLKASLHNTLPFNNNNSNNITRKKLYNILNVLFEKGNNYQKV
jgi:hypothetical protein